MANRQVKRTGKGTDAEITKLCNPDAHWSPRSKRGAVSDIDNKNHTYYVKVDGERVEVVTYEMNSETHLRTDPDFTDKNNLLELPDC